MPHITPAPLDRKSLRAAFEVIQRAEAHGFDFFMENGKLAVTFPEPEERWLPLKHQILLHKDVIAALVTLRAKVQANG